MNRTILFKAVKGPFRTPQALYLDDFRIAGDKPWGGGPVELEWKATETDVLRAFLPDLWKALDVLADATKALLDVKASEVTDHAEQEALLDVENLPAKEVKALVLRQRSLATQRAEWYVRYDAARTAHSNAMRAVWRAFVTQFVDRYQVP